MASVEFRGYANRVETKTSKNGRTFTKYSVGVKQKSKAYGNVPETVTWANFFVTDFSGGPVPTEKSFVTVKGFLSVKEIEKDGVKRTFLEVNAQEVEIAPPFEGDRAGGSSKPAARPAPKAAPQADSFDDDLPF